LFLSNNYTYRLSAESLRNIRSSLYRREADGSDSDAHSVILHGMRVESANTEWDEGIVHLLSYSTIQIRLFGENLTPNTMLAFTPKVQSGDGFCEFPSAQTFKVF